MKISQVAAGNSVFNKILTLLRSIRGVFEKKMSRAIQIIFQIKLFGMCVGMHWSWAKNTILLSSQVNVNKCDNFLKFILWIYKLVLTQNEWKIIITKSNYDAMIITFFQRVIQNKQNYCPGVDVRSNPFQLFMSFFSFVFLIPNYYIESSVAILKAIILNFCFKGIFLWDLYVQLKYKKLSRKLKTLISR